jgi:hypothetical protein
VHLEHPLTTPLKLARILAIVVDNGLGNQVFAVFLKTKNLHPTGYNLDVDLT